MRILAYMSHMGHAAVWDNMYSLVKALSYMGHEVRISDINNVNEQKGVLYQLLADPESFDMSIGFNDMGLEWRIEGIADPVHIYEELKFPHVSIMLDEPFNKCVSGYDSPCKNHIVTYINRPDLYALDFMYPNKPMKKLFMPLGGTENNIGEQALEIHKEYDVVVSAGIWNGAGEGRPPWHDADIPMGIVNILDDVSDILYSYPVSLLTAFEEVLRSRGMYAPEFLSAMEPYFLFVLSYIKPWRRRRMIKCLTELGIRVDIFGGGWESSSFSESMVYHGAVSYSEMMDVISKTKVLVQDEAMFNDGAHDRVFTAMLNGAVVVSEYSTYLEELFENQKDIFMFDWQSIKDQLGVIPQLLNDEQYRLSIAMSAYGKVAGKHTWKNRAERIIETVELASNIE